MDYYNTQSAVAIKEYLDREMPRYLEILRDMVGINSYTLNPAGVERLADYTAGAFSGLGFADERVPSAFPAYGKHLVLSRGGASGRKIGLVSHLDTVFSPEEEERNDFRWRVEGDRAYGPGTEDIKGGTVVALMTLEALRRAAPALFEDISWTMLLDASEETVSDDFGALCVERLGPDALACLIFEAGKVRGSDFQVVASRKGRAEIRVSVEGRGAHSGVAHDRGASAIRQIAEVVQKMESVTNYGRGLTVNVGRIAGGSQINRVPHFAEAIAEMRAFIPEVLDAAIEEVLALDGFSTVKSADGEFACTTSVELVRKVPAWPDNDGSKKVLSHWQAAGELLGCTVHLEKRGGLSDGNYFWDRIPTIDGLGPSGSNPHCSERSADGSKEQEYSVISSFVPRAVLNAMAILHMVGK
ncbi:MAG TPA: M20/M25/M40 family metallo-hydrolase [Spirochaetota bacterium]|nr:M20/M25/M40 family metallo-hydrolase [Spirochaetota bacterium]HOD15308.1 M20/M25/M40 family metallo-hydrolase [Spirochaetota bacterium]HPG50896.1 M20/M25/M40 family metallo-hydrolase [Spirochaetota bacterium]HPN13873.1 M20/M25/M40 family metallo-hydrolase [Spirochaetota bacterium]HQL81992.1 M20/M25/M40 family metallo-hydrolase [Spirochaetota bacterium]